MNQDLISNGFRPFRFQVDWLSFTFKRPDRDPSQQLEEFLKTFSFLEQYFDSTQTYAGGNHFEYGFRFSDGVVMSYDVHNEKGVNLSISGSHLGFLFDWIPELQYSDNPLRTLLIYLDNHYSRVSRIDFAFDDFDMVYSPLEILNLKMQNRVVTPYKDSNFFFAGDVKTGYTIQFGKRCSGSHLRIYDKNLESNGEIPAIRYEFELHAKTARDVCAAIIKDGDLNFKEFFLSKFKILSDRINEFEHKYNCPIDPIFQKFIDMKFEEFLFKDPLLKSQVSRTPGRILNGFIRSLKIVLKTLPALPDDFIKEIIMDLYSRFDKRDWKTLEENKFILQRILEADIYNIL